MSGKEYVSRHYRERMGSRFRSFRVASGESDLWIGVDPVSWRPEMELLAAAELGSLRAELESYIARRPEFRRGLEPIAADPEAPGVAAAMLAAGAAAGVGPMAAVAGAVAESVGRAIEAEFGAREVVVENGGDIWLRFEEEIAVSVFAGESPLSERIGVSVPPSYSPLGICTSSGTVGPSLSFGKADASMVACRDAALADAWATALGNMVRAPEDIEAALSRAGEAPGLLAALVVIGDKMGLRGELRLRLFER